MASDETAVEMFVGGLVLDPNTQAPVVVLKNESGDMHLPIWIGVAEATSIASAIKELEMSRPLTHDLMQNMFDELSVRVVRIMITELKDSTYYSELVLSFGDKAIILDSRPSDAIAVALRSDAPIYVTKQVLEEAKIVFSEEKTTESDNSQENEYSSEKTASSAEQGVASSEEDDVIEQSKNFKDIDKEKWTEMLAQLDQDDFKYKT